MQVNRLAMLVPLFLLLLLPGCLTRQQVQADVWLQSGLSGDECVMLCQNYCTLNPDKCTKDCKTNPEQYPNGIYRALDTNPVTYEIISYCAIGDDKKPVVQHYFNIEDVQFNNILNALLPASSGSN